MASLASYAKDKGVKYFLIAFVDLFGTMRAKIVPATAIDMIAKSGAGFAGFATWLDLTPAHPDMLVMAEADTAIQLPWKPEVAWVTGDLVMDGKPLAQNPRQVLKRIVAAAAESGYEMKTGVECEYFLIAPDGSAISDGADTQAKPCYDQQALMRRYEVIKEICDAMIALGWNPYQNDHEDANGQFEMNWEYDSCLRTADKHAFFKFMVKSIAEKHGLRATFMPKPFLNLTGNGCHAHVSLWSKQARTCSRTRRASWASPRRPITSSAGSCIRPMRWPPSPTRPSTPTSASTRRAPPRAPPGRPTRSPTAATTART